MNDDVMEAVREGAETLIAECDGLYDALAYVGDLADDTNADLCLGYEKDSDSYAVLYKACEDAVRKAARR